MNDQPEPTLNPDSAEPTIPPKPPVPTEPTPEAETPTSAEPTSEVEPQMPELAPVQDQAPAPAPTEAPKKSNKLIIIVIAAVAIISLAVTAVILLMPKESDTKKDEPVAEQEEEQEEVPSIETEEENPARNTALLKLYAGLPDSIALSELKTKVDSSMKLDIAEGYGSILVGDEIINFSIENGTTAKEFLFAKHIDDLTQHITQDEEGGYLYHNGVQQKHYDSKAEAISHYLRTKDF